jgi:hypothetical protein
MMAQPRPRPPEEKREEGTHPAVRDYSLACLIALLVVGAVLVQGGLGWGAALPVLAGGVALTTSWGIGPPVVLALVAAALLYQDRVLAYRRYVSPDSGPLADLALAAALVVYVAGQYRLMSLVRRAYPWDWRRARQAPGAGARPPALVAPGELLSLLLGVALFALVAFWFWSWFSVERAVPRLSFRRETWHAVALVLLGGAALAVAASVLGYLGWARATRAESLLYLQDQVWAEMRGEQGRLNRWLVWARLRAQRRKEGR